MKRIYWVVDLCERQVGFVRWRQNTLNGSGGVFSRLRKWTESPPCTLSAHVRFLTINGKEWTINATPSRLKIKHCWNSECLFFLFIRHSAQFTSLLSFLFFLFSFNFIVFIISWMDCKVLIRQAFVSFPDLNRFVRRREKKSAFALGVSSLRDVCHDWK